MISPRTIAQTQYLSTLKKALKPIIIASGPAGTGKTLFACQVAAENLADRKVDRIVITRPSVSVDENLGHLPGKMEEKMAPWTRPMFDIMDVYFPNGRLRSLVKQKKIEIAPLGFMRGRTFDNTFVIADEMQNSTTNQMKMLLTRCGEGTRMVVTGDTDQCDLGTMGGLEDILHRIPEHEMQYIDHIVLSDEDIQRHPVVKEILQIYS